MTGQHTAMPNDAAYKEQLVKDNMGFVIAMAKQYVNRGLPLDDLVSEGYVGLIKAAEKYDGTKGAKFTSYAANYVRKSILDALEGDRRYDDNASTRIEGMASNAAPVDERVEQNTVTDEIIASLHCLNERERAVIMHSFGIDGPHMTFAEIGSQLGVTRERVRQIRKKALRHLRKSGKDTQQ